MPDAREEIRTWASRQCRNPAYEVWAGAKDGEYSSVPFAGGLQNAVYLPSTRASFKQSG
jgi:hypothetical protein